MQFLFLLLFNVFLGAVLYLVISLKLERSASEFRERRLRQEMDEIIKEFNITAERNITLLENKIRVLRMLLEKSGDHRSLDIVTEQEEKNAVPVPGTRNDAAGEGDRRMMDLQAAQRRDDGDHESGNNALELVKKGLILLFGRIIPTSLRRTESTAVHPGHHAAGSNDAGEVIEQAPAAGTVLQHGMNALIEKDMVFTETVRGIRPETKKLMTEKDILEIVAMAEDRYQLVSLLSESGCDIDDISRYSGMPAGEVRLVLNLGRRAPGSPA